MYIPLRVHGWHSLLTGVHAPGALLERAARLGLPAMALSDIDTLSGSTEFLGAALEGWPRPILGAEISDPSGRPGRVIALVRDEEGYRNLCKLVSARQLGDDPGIQDLPEDRLAGPEGFDLVEGTVRFQRGLAFLVDHPRLAFALAGHLTAEQLFIAISPASLHKRSTRARGSRVVEDDTRIELPEHPKVPPPSASVPAEELIQTARALGLATLAVPDVYWAQPKDYEHHRVRAAIKHNALRCDLPTRWLAERPGHLPSTEEMRSLYAHLPDVPGPLTPGGAGQPGAMERTLELGDSLRFVPPLGGVLFPRIELGPGETAYSRLCALAFGGAQERYTPLRPEVVRRLDFELSAIDEMGYAPYFLLVRRIADFASELGIPHVGRGSAADSLVAFCLKLTDADPLRYKLPFERFLNPARADRPDIDLDFCWRRRDEVLDFVAQAFGRERTAMISTLNRFGLRSAFREAALAEGLAPAEVNRWSKRLPWAVSSGAEIPFDGDGGEGEAPTGSPEGSAGFVETGEDSVPSSSSAFPASPASPGRVGARDGTGRARARDNSRGAEEAKPPLPPGLCTNPVAIAIAAAPECHGFPFEDPRYVFILRVAEALLDAPRHLGLHPGGVVVSPGPITDIVSCQRATKGVVMTQLDKHGVEAVGLVKMDLLGNRALTVIDDCLRWIEEREGARPDLEIVSETDAKTVRLLKQGKTLGCFQVESPGMRHLLQQTAARSMDDVIQAVALIRPGPASSGMKDAYIRRFRGMEPPTPPHPRLTELLWETHGVMLYQEDVMQAVVLLAGMDLSTADELRRALAKRRGQEIEELRRRFFQGCKREAIERSDVTRIWELISNFSSFGFCKAHAVTYGRIAYRTVHLKAHYPAAYLTAFLNSLTGYYETRVYIEEARRLGVPILPPDVNRSQREFSLEDLRTSPSTQGLRIGLARVKGITANTLERIIEERTRAGAFLSLPDFLARTRARIDEVEHLIQSGAFDAFDRTRPEMLWRLHLITTPQKRPPKDLLREGGALDAGQLAACRTTPDQRANESTPKPTGEQDGAWGQGRLQVSGLGLRPGESSSLFPEPRVPALALPSLPETDPVTRGLLELEILGLTVEAHPTELIADDGPSSRSVPEIPCADLARQAGSRVELRGWLAASRRVRTSNGRWMRFLTLEDTSGIAEVVLFPEVYARFGHRLTSRGPFRIRGRVEDQLGACTLHAERIHD